MRRIHLQNDISPLSFGTESSSNLLQTAPLSDKSMRLRGVVQNPFILVIDDSPTVRKIVEICLRREGFNVESYPDGIEALRTFTTHPQKHIPDLVILDIDLPKMNGYEIARYLRSKPQWKRTVIVILSRHTGVIEQLKARLAGAQAYLTKPFTTEMIIATVHNYLGLSTMFVDEQPGAHAL